MNRNSKLISVLAVAFALMISAMLAGCGQQASSSAASSVSASASASSASASSASASTSASASAASDASEVSFKLTIDATDADKGVLFDESRVASKGETVYQALLDTNLPVEVSSSSGSAYVYGIGDVVVDDKTPTAGWLFTVNGEMPTVGADQLEINDGDVIVWTYYSDATKAM